MARCPFAEWLPSPNYSLGRPGSVIGAMQHSTVSGYDAAVTYLRTARGSSSTSAHFVIRLSDGHIAQLVDTANQAWHALSCNARWVGIEHSDDGAHWDPVRTPAEYAASARLNLWLAQTHGYAPNADTIQPHRNCVSTACPSGLDIERIIIETIGGDMADYLLRSDFDIFVAQTVKYIGDRLGKDAHHTHSTSEPIEKALARGTMTAARAASQAAISRRIQHDLLAFLPKRSPARRATKAHARAGHGVTRSQLRTASPEFRKAMARR